MALPPRRGRRSLLYVAYCLIGLAVAGVIWVLAPRLASPPRTITLANGPEGGAYADLGPRYQRVRQRSGLALRLLTCVTLASAGMVPALVKLSLCSYGGTLVQLKSVTLGLAFDQRAACTTSNR